MLRQSVKNKKKGFTIIEVVLVLAIAGLIFLMVFVAFPQLQRNQRDTQRRNDMARFLTAVMNYQTNNRNRLPFTAGGEVNANFITNYLKASGDTFEDPSAGDYTFAKVYDCSTSTISADSEGNVPCVSATSEKLGEINIYTTATCSGETPIKAEGNRKFAFTLKLEGAGTYCGQN